MLGRIRAERRWLWAAHGKHPAAKDYFTVGDFFPLAKAFSDWVTRGYESIGPMGSNERAVRPSWRFWTREQRRDHVACGILKESSDGVGRTYPLLLMGTGPLADWEGNWDLVPFSCESVWSQMEYLSTKSFRDLRLFEEEIRTMRPPSADWAGFSQKRKDIDPHAVEALRERLLRLPAADPFLCLDGQPHEGFDLVAVCHRLCKGHSGAPPTAVFMGGTVARTHFGLMRRPLATSDFVRMWTDEER